VDQVGPIPVVVVGIMVEVISTATMGIILEVDITVAVDTIVVVDIMEPVDLTHPLVAFLAQVQEQTAAVTVTQEQLLVI